MHITISHSMLFSKIKYPQENFAHNLLYFHLNFEALVQTRHGMTDRLSTDPLGLSQNQQAHSVPRVPRRAVPFTFTMIL